MHVAINFNPNGQDNVTIGIKFKIGNFFSKKF